MPLSRIAGIIQPTPTGISIAGEEWRYWPPPSDSGDRRTAEGGTARAGGGASR